MLQRLKAWWTYLNTPIENGSLPTKLHVSSQSDLNMYDIYFWPETGMMKVEYPTSSINFCIDDKDIEACIKNIYTEMKEEVLSAIRKSKKVLRK